MKNAVIRFALPATRVDGSALAPEDISAVRIYRQLGAGDPEKVADFALTGSFEFTDLNLAPGIYKYTATVVDRQNPPQESEASNEVAGEVTVDVAAPGAPVIVSVTIVGA